MEKQNVVNLLISSENKFSKFATTTTTTTKIDNKKRYVIDIELNGN